ncbi:MAG: tetratricopeptide repeat protein [Clostridia bacterium]|nr:tetratricopeptide repeat protein [Clostridia bacterium]
MQTDDWVRAEDYAEPRCLLCDEPHGAKPKPKHIPWQRVREKFDAYTSANDYAGARRHMLYWLDEARLGGDLLGEFQIHNELMGLYRKTAQEKEAFQSMDAALTLVRSLRLDARIDGATALLNAATVCSAFGQNEKALSLFTQAKEIYDKQLAPDDPRMGGLCNNMGLSLVALGRYDEADALYRRALEVMAHAPHGALEQAITYLNMADAAFLRSGEDKQADEYLETALGLLEDERLARDGYYAFVCEKCAPTFLGFGWDAYGKELQERAREIYERN